MKTRLLGRLSLCLFWFFSAGVEAGMLWRDGYGNTSGSYMSLIQNYCPYRVEEWNSGISGGGDMEVVDCYVTEGPVRSSADKTANWVVRFSFDVQWHGGTSSGTWSSIVYTVEECNKNEEFDEQGNCYRPDDETGAPPPRRICPSKHVGNPINITNGNKYQREVDFQSEQFSLVRHYNSRDQRRGLFGVGWTSDFGSRIEFVTLHSFPEPGSLEATIKSSAVVIDQSGRRYTFEQDGESWVYAGSGFARLQPDGDRWVFSLGDKARNHYSGDGRIILRDNGEGEKITYHYSENGDLDKILNGENVLARLTYSGGMVDKIAVGGGAYKFDYSGELLSSVSLLNNDQEVVSTKRYLYENTDFPSYLTGIMDEEGVRAATWGYDEQGRATLSDHDNADTVNVEYLTPLSTGTTNALGKKTIYYFEQVNGEKEIVKVHGEPTENCLMSNKMYAYDERGYVEIEVDSNNIATLYSRDEQGQVLSGKRGLLWADSTGDGKPSADELSDTPFTKEVITEYHPELNKPVKITEPGKVTTMAYDAEGRLLSNTTQSTVAP